LHVFDQDDGYAQAVDSPENMLAYGRRLNKYPDGHFDYVHQGLHLATIPTKAWKHVLDDMARVTKPSGFLELYELELLPDPSCGYACARLERVFSHYLKNAFAVDPRASWDKLYGVERHGFGQVKIHVFRVPMGYCMEIDPQHTLRPYTPRERAATTNLPAVEEAKEQRAKHIMIQTMSNAVFQHFRSLYHMWAAHMVEMQMVKQQEITLLLSEWERDMVTVGGWTRLMVVTGMRSFADNANVSDPTRSQQH
jgi:hypothetical protein